MQVPSRRTASSRKSWQLRGDQALSYAAQVAAPLAQRRYRLAARRDAVKFLLVFAGSAAAAYLVFGVLMGVAVVRGDSMNPAYRDGDVVLFARLPLGFEAGDVVLIKSNGRLNVSSTSGFERIDFLKRVVASPGDTVDIRDGAVIVNGTRLVESYAQGFTDTKGGQGYPVTLSDGEYFVLGDNRKSSADSRNYGPVKADEIEGRATAVLHAV